MEVVAGPIYFPYLDDEDAMDEVETSIAEIESLGDLEAEAIADLRALITEAFASHEIEWSASRLRRMENGRQIEEIPINRDTWEKLS